MTQIILCNNVAKIIFQNSLHGMKGRCIFVRTKTENNMTLIQTLTEQTQMLKTEYVNKCMDWAIVDFERQQKINSWRELDWCKYFRLTPEAHNAGRSNEWMGMPRNFYNTRDAREMDSMKNKARRIVSMGLNDYLIRTERNAVDHYTASIEKLAARILKKGLIESNVKVVTGRVGVNIESTVTDGIKTVRAWTIIASGAIQQPHYRYLIK